MKKIGLALGGGSARGLAHIGVLQALEKKGIKVDFIAGSSIGSLIGGVYASGLPLYAMERLALETTRKKMNRLMDFAIPWSGFISGKKVREFIWTLVGGRKIESLGIPFAAVATDLDTGMEVVLRKGPLAEAIRASVSIPGIFAPVKLGGNILVDGDLSNPVPVSVLRRMGADYIIAVNVISKPALSQPGGIMPHPLSALMLGRRPLNLGKVMRVRKIREFIRKIQSRENDMLPNIVTVMSKMTSIVEYRIAESSLKDCRPDLLIEPRVGRIGFSEFYRAQECIQAGRSAALSKLKDLRIR
jgi:NTE family protein